MANPRKTARKSLRLTATVLAATTLAGCSWFSAEQKETVARRGCPTIGVLSDASEVTLYRPGGGRDLTDVQYSWELLDAALVCEYDDDTLVVDYGYRIGVELGPAADRSVSTMPVFLAVTRRDQSVERKTVTESVAEFSGTHRYTMLDERVDGVRIPLGENEDGSAYELVLGFQLTPEQVEENRARAAY